MDDLQDGIEFETIATSNTKNGEFKQRLTVYLYRRPSRSESVWLWLQGISVQMWLSF